MLLPSSSSSMANREMAPPIRCNLAERIRTRAQVCSVQLARTPRNTQTLVPRDAMNFQLKREDEASNSEELSCCVAAAVVAVAVVAVAAAVAQCLTALAHVFVSTIFLTLALMLSLRRLSEN